jgi:hypothetical protein
MGVWKCENSHPALSPLNGGEGVRALSRMFVRQFRTYPGWGWKLMKGSVHG